MAAEVGVAEDSLNTERRVFQAGWAFLYRWIKLDMEGLDLATCLGRVEGSWSIQCEWNLT